MVWSERASADFQASISFIAADDPNAADRVGFRIVTAADALGRHPTGRPARVEGCHEKSLTDVHYIIAYNVDEPVGVITILRIIHTMRQWLPGTWPD